jgi:hypothetical protein
MSESISNVGYSVEEVLRKPGFNHPDTKHKSRRIARGSWEVTLKESVKCPKDPQPRNLKISNYLLKKHKNKKTRTVKKE